MNHTSHIEADQLATLAQDILVRGIWNTLGYRSTPETEAEWKRDALRYLQGDPDDFVDAVSRFDAQDGGYEEDRFWRDSAVSTAWGMGA